MGNCGDGGGPCGSISVRPSRVGIHLHDDSGCGVANSVAAIHAGAVHVQGTINGYGERCGNANLCVVIPNIELKLKLRALPEGHLVHLQDVANFVAEVANFAPNDQMAYVGNSAFAHKAGVHVSAMQRHPDAYQHIDPKLVGNEMRVVVSELSGRANIIEKATQLGLAGLDDKLGAKVVEVIKGQGARRVFVRGRRGERDAARAASVARLPAALQAVRLSPVW